MDTEAQAWILRLLRESEPQSWLLAELLAKGLRHRLADLFEKFSIPGLALHHAMRKNWIERKVRTELAAGCRALVVLGGGLDTLALRSALEWPEGIFLELDHPATQAMKRRALEKAGYRAANLKLLPTDLQTDDAAALALQAGLRGGDSVVFICEGVLMYLEEQAVQRLLAGIARHFSRGTFIFSFMERQVNGDIHFHGTTWAARLWLRWAHEPFRWGITQAELPHFLEKSGWRLEEIASTGDVPRSLPGVGSTEKHLAKGELLCLARK